MPDVRRDNVLYVREPDFLYCSARADGLAAHSVARAWNLRAARCGTAVERAVPDSCFEVFFSLGPFGRHLVGPEVIRASVAPRDAWVVGPHATSIFLAKEVLASDVVAVRILPGLVPAVLGVSADQVSGRVLDLELFWGRSAVAELRERLFHEADPLVRVRWLEHEVARRSLASPYDSNRIRQLCEAVDQVPNPSVSAIARLYGLSHRRVIALFENHIGLKPKVYQRVQRLRRVLEVVSAGRVRSWASLACECGYCDQAHFINDFQRLTGTTPTLYDQKRSPYGAGVMAHALADAAAS